MGADQNCPSLNMCNAFIATISKRTATMVSTNRVALKYRRVTDAAGVTICMTRASLPKKYPTINNCPNYE